MRDKHVLAKKLLEDYRQGLSYDATWPTKIICAAKFIIENLYDRNLSVRTVTKECYLNNYNLSATFKHYTMHSPIEYIVVNRIEASKQILENRKLKDLLITNVALYVGFTSSSSFATTFKNHVGTSPSKWKKVKIGQLNI